MVNKDISHWFENYQKPFSVIDDILTGWILFTGFFAMLILIVAFS